MVDGDDAAFALSIGRGFSKAKAPFADDESGEAARPAIDDIGPETWTPPFYLRYRLATAGGVVLSGAWLAAAAYFIDRQILWPDLMVLLPHEIGGLAAGVLTPLALLWMVIAFFERGRKLHHETRALHWYFSRLTYPSDRAESRVAQVTESLRRQARELSQASAEAVTRSEAIDAQVRKRAVELSQVSHDADLRAQAIAEALRRQTGDLEVAAEKAAERAREVECSGTPLLCAPPAAATTCVKTSLNSGPMLSLIHI